MFCVRCGKAIPNDYKFCPHCGYNFENLDNVKREPESSYINASTNNKKANGNSSKVKMKESKIGIVALISVLLSIPFKAFLLLGIILSLISFLDKNKTKICGTIAFISCILFIGIVSYDDKNQPDEDVADRDNGAVEYIVNTDDVQTEENMIESAKETVNISSDFSNMRLGDIGKSNDLYVSLTYVKRMSGLPTALDSVEPVDAGKEVILGFFDIYNNSGKEQFVNFTGITCYADGVKVDNVETSWKVRCDNILQFYGDNLQKHMKVVSVHDFEVPSGWNELKFFYNSECVWTISQSDVSEEAFVHNSPYEKNESFDITEEGTVVYDSNFQLTYMGKEEYTEENSYWGNNEYIIFKFLINNTGDQALDYLLAGYEMQAYGNGYLLGDASFGLDDKIGEYINIYDIDSIEKGMSAYIYVAFNIYDEYDNYYMIYDDGYISNDVKATLYVE